MHFIYALYECDRRISAQIANFALNPAGKRFGVRTVCLLLEWSMHGIPWLIGAFLMAAWANYSEFKRAEIYCWNLLLLALLVDLAVVGAVKITFRRGRPAYNKDDQSEKGNVARIVNRLSKDFGAGTGPGGTNSIPSVLANRTENVPLRNRVASNNAAQIGWVEPGAAPTATAAARETAIVRFSYAAQQPDELDLKEGDELLVLEQVEDGWARGELLSTASQPARRGRIGLYPTNFVSTVAPTPATQTAPLNTISAGNTSTFPRAVDTGHKEKHQIKQESTGNISMAELMSPTAPKSPGTLISYTNGSSNGTEETSGTSPAILHPNNVLPSSLLRTTGGGGSLGQSAGANTRRVMSTLISGTTGNVEQQQQAVQPMGQNKAKEFAKVLYKYDAAAPDELSLPEGAIVAVLNRQCEDEGWFVAELDGRRGLFPDNFVKFLPSEPAQPFHTLGAQQPPPSLPAKPQKFQQQHSHNPPPVANTRDSLSALLFNNSSSATNSPDTAHPPAPTMDKLMSASTTTAVDADTENNNSSSGCNVSASLLGTKHLNTAGNRLSQKIQILQKNLEQGGGIPIGPRPPTAAVKDKETTQNVPKEADKNTETQQADPVEPKPVLLVAEHVKARAQIGKPQNRRPPSKVNSAALLAADSNDDDNLGGNSSAFNNNNNHTAIKPHPPSHSPSPSPTRQKPAKKEAEKSIPTGKTTVFSSQAPQSPVDAKPLLCSINEEQSNTNISAGQHKSTALFQCPPNLPPNPAHQQPHLPKAAHSPASSNDTSSSQWVSRADFERFAEDCQRKFAEMQAELRELRARVEKAEKK